MFNKIVAVVICGLVAACLWFRLQAVEAVSDLQGAQYREELLETALKARIKAAAVSKEVMQVRETVRLTRIKDKQELIEGDANAVSQVPEWSDTRIPDAIVVRLRE